MLSWMKEKNGERNALFRAFAAIIATFLVLMGITASAYGATSLNVIKGDLDDAPAETIRINNLTTKTYESFSTDGDFILDTTTRSTYCVYYMGETTTTPSGSFTLRFSEAATDADGDDCDVIVTVSDIVCSNSIDAWSDHSDNLDYTIMNVFAGAVYQGSTSGLELHSPSSTNVAVSCKVSVQIVKSDTGKTATGTHLFNARDLDVVCTSDSSYTESVTAVSGFASNAYLDADTKLGVENTSSGTRFYATDLDDGTDLSTVVIPTASGEFSFKWSAQSGAGTIILSSFKTSTITATASSGGSISDPGDSTVFWKNDKTYTITPSTGYHVSKLTVDGEQVSTASSYKFSSVTSDHTIHADFALNTYEIAFDANTGDGTMANQAMTYDVAANLSANAFAKTGYTWTGWNTKADGTGDAYTDKQEVENLTAEKDGVVTLYSQWEANGYIVRFHANEGTGTMDDQSFVYDVAQALDDNEFTRAGYTFQGWATSEDGAVVYTDEEVVKNLAADDGAVVDLYAVWDENADVTITYKPEDDHSTVSNDDDVVPPATGEPEGSTATTEEGYHFVGWVDAEGNLLSDDPIYMPERGEDGLWHAMTVYSRVAPNGYSVTFDANEGTGSMEDESFTYDVAQPLDPNSFEREGYTFTGWNTEPDGTGTAFADEEEVKNLTTEDGGNVVVYAQWIANEYVVEFDANSGDGEMDDQSFVYDVAQELNANAFTKTGYTWTGWNTKADGTGDSYADAEEVKNLTAENGGTVTLYSQWEANAYVVHFNGNGGEGTMDDQSFTYDEAQQLSENAFARDGYFFKGWALTEDGEVVYTDMEEVVNLVADDGGEITLYAVWEAVADNSAATSSSADGSFSKTGASTAGIAALAGALALTAAALLLARRHVKGEE